LPLIAQDLTRLPDTPIGGPEVPADETARRRLFRDDGPACTGARGDCMHTGRLQALMIANGGLVLLLGMLCGLPFAFHLLGRIELWPIPWAIALPIPGPSRRWRRA